jgi:hypothetical protein
LAPPRREPAHRGAQLEGRSVLECDRVPGLEGARGFADLVSSARELPSIGDVAATNLVTARRLEAARLDLGVRGARPGRVSASPISHALTIPSARTAALRMPGVWSSTVPSRVTLIPVDRAAPGSVCQEHVVARSRFSTGDRKRIAGGSQQAPAESLPDRARSVVRVLSAKKKLAREVRVSAQVTWNGAAVGGAPRWWHGRSPAAASWPSDGRSVLTASTDGGVRLWDAHRETRSAAGIKPLVDSLR